MGECGIASLVHVLFSCELPPEEVLQISLNCIEFRLFCGSRKSQGYQQNKDNKTEHYSIRNTMSVVREWRETVAVSFATNALSLCNRRRLAL